MAGRTTVGALACTDDEQTIGRLALATYLIPMIDRFATSWNEGGTPLDWAKTADEILAKAVHKNPVNLRIATRSWLPANARTGALSTEDWMHGAA